MKKIFTLVSLLLAFTLQGYASVSSWGKLKLVGNQLCSESGNPVQLRGWSTHGKNWQGSCFDEKSDFELMKNNGANMARIAMYLTDGGSEDIEWVKQCIQWTNELDMYCLVDWHILTPGNPNSSTYSGAENFFKSLSSFVISNNYKNVVYEICNEPNEDTDGDPHRPKVWGWIKKYCNKILPAIAANDPTAVVVVGTPQWDKALSLAIEDPIDTYGLNVMYTFHNYCYDQQRYMGILSAAAAFMPVFVTEWGLSGEDGGTNGQISETDADHLMNICNGQNLGGQVISWANWSWSQDYRSSSAFSSYPNSWTASGNYIKNRLGKGDQFGTTESTAYETQTFDGVNDFYLALEKYDKGGMDVAYFDFDEDWACASGSCNAGDWGKDGNRDGEYVDVGYCDKNNKETSYKNLGYIGQGEWVKYTLDIKKAGIYDFELYTCNHIDTNIVAFSIDGKNALVDQDGNEKYMAVKMQTSGSGVTEGGYDDCGWTKVKSPYSESTSFKLKFPESGTHKLGIVFFTSCSGLGSLKLIGNDDTNVEDYDVATTAIWPNPSEDGSFFVSVKLASTVTVSNVQGVVFGSQEIPANADTEINMNLAAGIYFVNIRNNSGSITEKLIVK